MPRTLLLVVALAAALPTCAARAHAQSPTGAPTPTPAAPAGDLLLVLEKDAATARLLDPTTGASVATWPTGPFPHEVVVSPDGRTAVVADYGAEVPGSTLTVLDLPGRRVARTISLGRYRRPHGIVWLPGISHSQAVAVTVEQDQAVLVVDVAAGTVVRAIATNERGTHMLALGATAPLQAYTANIGGGSVSQLDLAAGTLVRTVRTGRGPEAIDVTPDGRELWVADRQLNVIGVRDARTLDSLATLPTGAFPNRLRFTPDGRTALVSNAAASTLSVYDVPTRALRGVVTFPLDTTRLRPSPLTASLGRGAVPLGVLVARDGRTAMVALAATGQIAVVDVAARRVLRLLDGGATPDGMAWVPRAARR
jgi:DNA-binding beta-propeller fold protein YncE